LASWEYLLIGLGLMLVFEGIMPFLSPATLRQYMRQIIELDDRSLRIAGLVAMLTGLAILYLIRP
jgi:uncharacterized protein